MQDNLKAYEDFIYSKILKSPEKGFNVEIEDLPSILKPHQKDVVKWALSGGCRAIFNSFGLGKTIIQLTIGNEIVKKYGGKFLQVLPLGVRQEFKRDAEKLLGIKVEYITNQSQVDNSECDILLTNYERVRDGDIDPSKFTGVSLDEASVLRSYGSKTYQTFLPKFENVKFKFVATATPSPNKIKELIHYAGYLGIMDTGQALTRFFQRNSQKANELTLYPHKEAEFWLWVGSWGLFLEKPSQLGYSDAGYDLPNLNIHWHMIPVDHQNAGVDSWGNVKMFRDSALSLQDAAKEKRDSIKERFDKSKEIIDSQPNDNWILWHDLESERNYIQKGFGEDYKNGNLQTIYGSQDYELREKKTIGFSNGEYRILATKSRINGSGCNFQYHCNNMVFMAINHKFNDIIQSIHRCYRFMQDKEVNVHFVYMESEESIKQSILKKWDDYNRVKSNMSEIIKKYGLTQSTMTKELQRTIGSKRYEHKTEYFTAVNNDTVYECEQMEENSVDMICTSIPFGNHYEYSPSYNDFGHNPNNDRFFEQMDFLVPNLLKVLKPGRIAAIHVKDRIQFANVTGLGVPSVEPFHVDTILSFRKNGFIFCGQITIDTDVVRENNQTYRLGWTEMCKDGTKMGCGQNEYVLLFRKPQTDLSKGYADNPVVKDKETYTRKQWQLDASGTWKSSGNRLYTPDELANLDLERIISWYKKFSKEEIYDYSLHVNLGEDLEKNGRLPAKYCLFTPQSNSEYIWTDIVRMRTLNSSQSMKKKQNHICPLQFDVVERLINRFTNEGEIVFDPFAGIMTVPYCAINLGRKGYGVELSSSYFNDGLLYLKAAEHKKVVPTLFDLEI